MTDRPPLTLQTIRDRQAAKGLRKYGVSLKDAGLPVGALALHALEECVDLLAYLHTAKLLDLDDSVCLLSIAERLLPLADHPAPLPPLPPDVPTAVAVSEHDPLWQLGRSVVEVVTRCGALCYREIGVGGSRPVEGAGPWLGPVVLRGGR